MSEQAGAASIVVPILAGTLVSSIKLPVSQECPCGCPVGIREVQTVTLWSSISRSSCLLVQSHEGVCSLPLRDSPAEAAGREITSQWKDGSWPPGLDQELPFSPFSVRSLSCFLLGRRSECVWEGRYWFCVPSGSGWVQLRENRGLGTQGWAALVWREESALQGDSHTGAHTAP